MNRTQQIYADLKAGIPPSRELAVKYGVSRNHVYRCRQMLKREDERRALYGDLSVRCQRALTRETDSEDQADWLEYLRETSDERLLRVGTIGKKSLAELREWQAEQA